MPALDDPEEPYLRVIVPRLRRTRLSRQEEAYQGRRPRSAVGATWEPAQSGTQEEPTASRAWRASGGWGPPAGAPAFGSLATAEDDPLAGPEVDYLYLPRTAGAQGEEGTTDELPQEEVEGGPRLACGRDAVEWEAALTLEPNSEWERALKPPEEEPASREPPER